nr:hypothetical protein [Tanacetum cinerariifolium]
MAFAIICLAINQKFNFSKYIFDNMEGKDFFGKVTPLFQSMMVQAPEDMGKGNRGKIKVPLPSSEIPNEEGVPITSNDPLLSGEDIMQLNELMILCTQKQEVASKQGRMIDNINQDVEITLVDDTQGRINKEDMFGVNDLDGDEVVVDVSTRENVEQSVKVIEKETLIEIKVAKPKAITTTATTVTAIGTRPKEKEIVMQEQSRTPSPKLIYSSQKLSQAKDIGKGKMVEPEKPLKRKEQIMIDEEVAKNLEAQMQAELEEEERLARFKMLFNNTMKWIKAFVPMDIELVKGSDKAVEGCEKAKDRSSKRAASNLEQGDAMQRLEKENESAKLKRCLEIIPENDDDVTIKATPLSSKSSTIVDYKIYKEGRKNYFKIIKAYGNS